MTVSGTRFTTPQLSYTCSSRECEFLFVKLYAHITLQWCQTPNMWRQARLRTVYDSLRRLRQSSGRFRTDDEAPRRSQPEPYVEILVYRHGRTLSASVLRDSSESCLTGVII